MARSIDLDLSRRVDTWLGLLLCALLYVVSRVHARLGGPPQPRVRATTPPSPGRSLAPPTRVLAIKLYGLGNVAMIVPVLDALRRAVPGVEIDFLTVDTNRTLVERCGLVERVIGLSVEGYGGVASSLWNALRTLRARRYDVVVDFEQFVKLSSIVAYLTGAPERVGFNTDRQRRGWLYTTRVVYTDGEHMGAIFMRLLKPFGIEPSPRPASFAVTSEERARVSELFAAHGVAPEHFPIVGLHVGSGPYFRELPLKRWPARSFAALADGLVERHRASIAFTGRGREERLLVGEVMAAMHHPAIDACDRLSVGELLALLDACDLVVSNDTSVMHLAAALGTPVAALFGPTSPRQYGPVGSDALVFYKDLFCSPCVTNYNLKLSHCSDPVCMRTITPQEVLAAIGNRLRSDPSPRRPVRAGGCG